MVKEEPKPPPPKPIVVPSLPKVEVKVEEPKPVVVETPEPKVRYVVVVKNASSSSDKRWWGMMSKNSIVRDTCQEQAVNQLEVSWIGCWTAGILVKFGTELSDCSRA